jgi:hypothetical protein
VAWNNLGNTLRMLGEIDQADVCLATALDQQPGYLSALKNRGTLWVWGGDVERGLKWYEQGLKVDPGHAELHRNLGVVYLLLGDYKRGWDEYRWRWKMPGLSRPNYSTPVWNGESLAGKSILLYPEQGRGDTIQFIRVIAQLHADGANVVFQCEPSLVPLMYGVRGFTEIIPDVIDPRPTDYQASLIDAMDYRFQQTGAMTFRSPLADPSGRYIDLPDGLAGYWRNWLEQQVSGIRIGINWQGNPEHHADVYRSIPLPQFEPLASIAGVTLVSLQFGFGSEQLDKVSFSDRVLRLPTPLDNSGGAFMDTAAIIDSLDAVVTTDTSIAHLAGALGKPVLLMIGKVPDWRWLTTGDTTPWYPNMKLFRQTLMGDWSKVIQSVHTYVTERVESGGNFEQPLPSDAT